MQDFRDKKILIIGGTEELEGYTSHNTQRLDVEGMKELLLKLEMVREDVLK